MFSPKIYYTQAPQISSFKTNATRKSDDRPIAKVFTPNVKEDNVYVKNCRKCYKIVKCRNSCYVCSRNELAHQVYSEEFQSGFNNLFKDRLYEFKSLMVDYFGKISSILTVKNIEIIISTIIILYDSTSIVAKMAAITLCINGLTGKAVSDRVIKFVSEHHEDFIGNEAKEQFESDSEKPNTGLREALDSWDRLNDSMFVNKIRNVASYCMAFSVLETLGLPEVAAEVVYAEFKVERKKKQVTSFLHAILDAVEFTFSRLIVCVKQGDLSPLLHTVNTYTKWFDKTQKLEKWTSMLTCDADTLEFTLQEYEKELIDVITMGQSFIKTAKSNADRKALTILVNKMEIYLADYQTKHLVGKARMMPFGILVYGDSSIGKSSFTDILFSYSAKVLKQKEDSEFKYTRNFRDQYMSGFKSHMWFIQLDDIGSVKPSAAQGTDPSIDELIALMNTVPFCCNMADLSEKGRVAARPLVVVGTSNHPWMNAHHYTYHPTAVMRRFPYRITPTVNKKYRMDDAPTMLDPNKCKDVDYTREYPNFWDITVHKILAAPLNGPNALPTSKPIEKLILKDCAMGEFLRWYKSALESHVASQKSINKNMASLSKVEMCEHLVPVGNCDICNPKPRCKGYPTCINFVRYANDYCGSCTSPIKIINEVECIFKDCKNITISRSKLCVLHDTDPNLPNLECITPGCGNMTYNMIEKLCLVCDGNEEYQNDNGGKNIVGNELIVYKPPVQPKQFWFGYQDFSIMDKLLGFAVLLYLWLIVGCRLPIAKILTYRYVLPLYRINNSASVSTSTWSMNYFKRMKNLTMPTQLPTRNQIGSIAERIFESAMNNKKYIAISTAILAIIALKKGLKVTDKFQFSFYKPVPKDEKDSAKWTNEDIHLSPLTVSRESQSRKGISQEESVRLFSKNVVAVAIINEKNQRMNQNVLGIGGNFYLFNKHVLDLCPEKFDIEFIFSPISLAAKKNVTISLSKKCIKHQVGDICILEINNFAPIANIVNYLPKRGFEARLHGMLLKRQSNGEIYTRDAKNIEIGTSKLLPDSGYWSDCLTAPGDCGSALLAFSAFGPVILGIHSVGSSNGKAFTSKIFYEDIEHLIIIDDGSSQLQSGLSLVELQPVINRTCPVFFKEESVCNIYGTFPSGTSNMKSRVGKTKIASYFERELQWSTPYEIPKLKGWKPWYHGFSDMTSPDFKFESSDADWLAEKTIFGYFERVSVEEKQLIQLYDFDTAVSGSPGVNYVNSLEMKTSLGFPWKKPKNTRMVFNIEEGKFDVDQEIVDVVTNMIECYRQGSRYNPIFCASTKDEPRNKMKNDQGMIRLFMGAPTPLVIVMRMFFGSLIRVVQRNPDKFGCAVGINAHSKEWNNLASRLLTHEDGNLFDGDYYAYDKKMESVLIYSAIFQAGRAIIANLDDFCGLTEKELLFIYKSIAADVAFAYVDFNGTLMSFLRNHVSGEPLTVIINCFVGGMYIRSSYLDVIDDDDDLSKFHDRVVEVLYGDDNVLGISNEIVDKFNFSTMQASLAKRGVKYTRADKKDGSYKTKKLEDIEFLKRGFVFNNDLNRYTGPLSEKSIQKSFLIGLRSTSVTQEERDVSAMNSGLREYFFHGKDKYNSIRNHILRCCDELELKYNIRNYPLYEEYLDKFRNQDIVHFEYFPPEEDYGDEQFQISIREDEEEDEIPDFVECIYYWNDLFFTCYDRYVSVDYIGLVDRRFLNFYYTHQNISAIEALKMNAHFSEKMFEVNLNRNSEMKEFFETLIPLMEQKLNELIAQDDDLIHLLFGREGNLDRLMSDWVTPAGQTYFTWRFKNNIRENSRSSITVVAAGRHADGAWNDIQDVSSDNTEQNYREEFQSSKEGLVHFSEETKGSDVILHGSKDRTRMDSIMSDSSIGKFLNRPVLIETLNWSEGNTLFDGLNPFTLFFTSPSIKRKIDNYSLLRCKLRVKFMINASPFYYGLAKIAWKPNPHYTYSNILIASDDGWKVPFTQVPGPYLSVENNESVEIELPFFYPKNWVDATSSLDFDRLGELTIGSLTPLMNANSVSGSDVTLAIYAWAEEVELSGPTITESLQSSEYVDTDEQHNTILTGVEVDDKGSSNIDNGKVIYQRPSAFAGMSTVDSNIPIESLTLHQKTKTILSLCKSGFDGGDELSISNICGRESFIYQVQWSSADDPSDLLFLSRVHPELIRNGNSTTLRYSTPMAHINRMFLYWRGDINFRFQFVCSKFHRGRARITYDPTGDLFTQSTTSTTSITRLVDISNETNVVIKVPFMQALSFLKTASGLTSSEEFMNGGTTILNHNREYDNGLISVRVLTKQTSPVADAPIFINVFVSAPDLEFAAPAPIPKNYSFTESLQSGSFLDVQDAGVNSVDDNIYKTHFGEKVSSLRILLKRQNLYYVGQLKRSQNFDDTAATFNKFTLPRMPVYYGYLDSGGFVTPGINVPGSQFRCNFVNNTPFSMLFPCFIGHSGSMIYTVNTDSPVPSGSIYVSRGFEPYSETNIGFAPVVSEVYITSSHGAISKRMYNTLPTGETGRVLTNQNTQAGITCNLPMYSNRRYLAINPSNIQSTLKVDGTEMDTITTVVITKPNVTANVESSTQVQFYYKVGDDFNLHYFSHIPTIRLYTLPWPTV